MTAPGGGDRLAGRIAVVVGAGQTPGPRIGNGRATAITFAAHGARLLLVDRDEARALFGNSVEWGGSRVPTPPAS
ncbi:MAG TPA: hypothetical protein PKC57_01945, partial [Microthrixaceae bacterium]|nr:hypothetical protein [Microthrixaceae bacterium]